MHVMHGMILRSRIPVDQTGASGMAVMVVVIVVWAVDVVAGTEMVVTGRRRLMSAGDAAN
jgi:hypothetical protein